MIESMSHLIWKLSARGTTSLPIEASVSSLPVLVSLLGFIKNSKKQPTPKTCLGFEWAVHNSQNTIAF